MWPPWLVTQLAELKALNAVAWFTLASPKLHSTILPLFILRSGISKSFARSIEKAVPTAFGKWLATVLVCGGMFNALLPMTLWRPPLMGSSDDAMNDNAIS